MDPQALGSMPDPLIDWSAGAVDAVAQAEGAGPELAARVRAAFDCPLDVLDATPEELAQRVPGIEPKLAAKVRSELLRHADKAAEEAYRRAREGGAFPNAPGAPVERRLPGESRH
ncbi:hypothetical protein [Thioalkalivibrio sp.]|uniref:hypothetical protein n=1 Tax=Thioalkalivibrio sp. TaxID=2093813 RepID=UPI003564E6D7